MRAVSRWSPVLGLGRSSARAARALGRFPRCQNEQRLRHLEAPGDAQADRRDQRRRHVDNRPLGQDDTAPAITPVAAAVAPSEKARSCGLARWRLNHGAGTTVSTQTGKKIPIAASVAPGTPATR